MKGSVFAATLPEGRNQAELDERSRLIVQAVQQGLFLPLTWHEVAAGPHAFMVLEDALRIGEPDDYLRVNVTAIDQQQIADVLGVSLLTAKMNDLAYRAAKVLLEPCMQPDSVKNGTMAHTTAMVRHSREVDAKLAGRTGLTATVCKTWVLSNKPKPGYAANHGWHTQKARPSGQKDGGPYPCEGGGWIWQNLGTHHTVGHVDYSQGADYAYPWVRVVEEAGTRYLPIEVVLRDAVLAKHFSYEGPLEDTRQPEAAVLPTLYPTWGMCF